MIVIPVIQVFQHLLCGFQNEFDHVPSPNPEIQFATEYFSVVNKTYLTSESFLVMAFRCPTQT